ncbi:hypothetical protein P1S61_37570 [Streptomyces sp. ME08-AFT2]|uniref:hypothetical protein n=1 Tax=Streptomyces sp. ME08-AFT2 TaxID=3028683 RepID=UPI0029B82034|nr:hypothetical protein [Streptomyces sp. ME08-AFT2]MDX3314667.1 hypothetical protein [Streptomyces sp. ME08-AFT2]
MKKLTGGQIAVLITATLPMIAVGVGGAIGTYANAASVLHRKETALGVVAAGEGATLVAALVMIGVTMLGQAAPLAIRAALWLLPAAASVMGLAIAPTPTEMVVFALTPLAMTAAAEGISFLARRIVVHRTGVDVEAQRRNAYLLRRIAYHRARAERHPWRWVRKVSALMAWRLMGQLGDSDATLGSALTDVQNTRIVDGANTALAAMLSSATELSAATPRPAVAPGAATSKHARATATPSPTTAPACDATPVLDATSDAAVPCYAPGTPQYVVRELWLRKNHRPTEGAVVEALGDAGLPNSRAQAGKIRRQVEAENPRLPGPRAA